MTREPSGRMRKLPIARLGPLARVLPRSRRPCRTRFHPRRIRRRSLLRRRLHRRRRRRRPRAPAARCRSSRRRRARCARCRRCSWTTSRAGGARRAAGRTGRRPRRTSRRPCWPCAPPIFHRTRPVDRLDVEDRAHLAGRDQEVAARRIDVDRVAVERIDHDGGAARSVGSELGTDRVCDGVEVIGGRPRPDHRAVGLELDEVAGHDRLRPAQRLDAAVGSGSCIPVRSTPDCSGRRDDEVVAVRQQPQLVQIDVQPGRRDLRRGEGTELVKLELRRDCRRASRRRPFR